MQVNMGLLNSLLHSEQILNFMRYVTWVDDFLQEYLAVSLLEQIVKQPINRLLDFVAVRYHSLHVYFWLLRIRCLNFLLFLLLDDLIFNEVILDVWEEVSL